MGKKKIANAKTVSLQLEGGISDVAGTWPTWEVLAEPKLLSPASRHVELHLEDWRGSHVYSFQAQLSFVDELVVEASPTTVPIREFSPFPFWKQWYKRTMWFIRRLQSWERAVADGLV